MHVVSKPHGNSHATSDTRRTSENNQRKGTTAMRVRDDAEVKAPMALEKAVATQHPARELRNKA